MTVVSTLCSVPEERRQFLGGRLVAGEREQIVALHEEQAIGGFGGQCGSLGRGGFCGTLPVEGRHGAGGVGQAVHDRGECLGAVLVCGGFRLLEAVLIPHAAVGQAGGSAGSLVPGADAIGPDGGGGKNGKE